MLNRLPGPRKQFGALVARLVDEGDPDFIKPRGEHFQHARLRRREVGEAVEKGRTHRAVRVAQAAPQQVPGVPGAAFAVEKSPPSQRALVGVEERGTLPGREPAAFRGIGEFFRRGARTAQPLQHVQEPLDKSAGIREPVEMLPLLPGGEVGDEVLRQQPALDVRERPHLRVVTADNLIEEIRERDESQADDRPGRPYYGGSRLLGRAARRREPECRARRPARPLEPKLPEAGRLSGEGRAADHANGCAHSVYLPRPRWHSFPPLSPFAAGVPAGNASAGASLAVALARVMIREMVPNTSWWRSATNEELT